MISKLSDKNDKYKRLIGIKPNGSDRTPKELSAMTKPVFDSPKEFAESLLQLKKRFGFKIIGCCWGTSKEHLREIAKTCSIGEAI